MTTIRTCDSSMIDLVVALNELPGIETFASCGGHQYPTRTQQPEGKWFVSFTIQETTEGFASLLCLFFVVALHHPQLPYYDLRLELHANSTHPREGTISGTDIYPWRVARMIQEQAEKVEHED